MIRNLQGPSSQLWLVENIQGQRSNWNGSNISEISVNASEPIWTLYINYFVIAYVGPGYGHKLHPTGGLGGNMVELLVARSLL